MKRILVPVNPQMIGINPESIKITISEFYAKLDSIKFQIVKSMLSKMFVSLEKMTHQIAYMGKVFYGN